MRTSPPPATERARRGERLALLSVALRPPSDTASVVACLEELLAVLDEDGPIREWVEAAAERARNARLEREYHRLFLGPTRPVAPPFESVYRDGVMLGPTAIEFLAELREAGFEPAREFRLPPDHVSVQLEYLASLELRADRAMAEGRMEEADECRQRAIALTDRHLGRWLPALSARLEAAAPESPYTYLVRAAATIVGAGSPRRNR